MAWTQRNPRLLFKIQRLAFPLFSQWNDVCSVVWFVLVRAKVRTYLLWENVDPNICYYGPSKFHPKYHIYTKQTKGWILQQKLSLLDRNNSENTFDTCLLLSDGYDIIMQMRRKISSGWVLVLPWNLVSQIKDYFEHVLRKKCSKFLEIIENFDWVSTRTQDIVDHH